MEIKGTIVANLGVQKGTSKAGKEWAKATIVVEYGEGQYPKRVALDNMKDADKFAALAVGTEGTFNFDVESREYNGRWFTSANCWKWEMAQQVPAQPAQQGWEQIYQQPAPQPQSAPAQDSDLPF